MQSSSLGSYHSGNITESSTDVILEGILLTSPKALSSSSYSVSVVGIIVIVCLSVFFVGFNTIWYEVSTLLCFIYYLTRLCFVVEQCRLFRLLRRANTESNERDTMFYAWM